MDTSGIGWQIAIILFLIIANGLFSMTEIAIVSSRKIRLEQMAEAGSKGALKALKLADDPTDLLSAVQIGITMIGIFTGAFGGAALAAYLAAPLKNIAWLSRYADALSLAIIVSTITYLSLIIGELTPKRLALNNPEAIAAMVARPMTAFVRLNRPLVRILSMSTKFVFAVLGVKPADEPPVTEKEVKMLIGRGTQHGIFEETEREMVEKIFILSDMRAGSLMTPRTQLAWLDLEDPLSHNLQLIASSRHEAFPVGRGSLDEIVGIIYTREVLARQAAGQAVNFEAMAVEPLYIPGTLPALKILDLFKTNGARIALVVDEFGGIDGLVTLTDVVERIIGEFNPHCDECEPSIVRRADGTWLLDGLLMIERFKELFQLDHLPGEDRELYHTLAGFALSQLGRIPSAGDSFEWNGLRFEVVDMDRSRIDKVLISELAPVQEEAFKNLPGELS